MIETVGQDIVDPDMTRMVQDIAETVDLDMTMIDPDTIEIVDLDTIEIANQDTKNTIVQDHQASKLHFAFKMTNLPETKAHY